MTQLGLFEYDEPPIPEPKRRTPPAGRSDWREITNARGLKCEVCMSLYTEMEFPPVARVAKWRRVCDGADTLFCGAHHQFEVQAERLEKAREDREQFSRRKRKA